MYFGTKNNLSIKHINQFNIFKVILKIYLSNKQAEVPNKNSYHWLYKQGLLNLFSNQKAPDA